MGVVARTYDSDAEEAAAQALDRSIPFVDAHHHLWDLQSMRYSWLDEPPSPDYTDLLGDYRSIRVTWSIERMLKEFYGSNVAKSVHVEAAYSGADPVEETRWLEGIRAGWRFPHGLVVNADLEAGGLEQLERHLAASPRVRGVRPRVHPDWPPPTAFGVSLRTLIRLGLSYELNASPGRLLSGREMAQAHPSLIIVLGSAGLPLRRDPAYMATWAQEIRSLAREPNIVCKISGLAMVDHDWTVDSHRPIVLECIDAFGVSRCMFGTNWPVDALYSSYLRQVDAYRLILADAGFARRDQLALLSGNAERLYAI